MLRRRQVALALTLAALLPTTGSRGEPHDAETEVLATLAAFAAHANALEWDEVLDFYMDDERFRWMENGALVYADEAAVADAIRTLEPMLDAVDLRLIEPHVVVLSERHAHASMRFEQNLEMVSGGSFRLSGAITILLERGDAGWRFLGGHTSSAPASEPGREA